MQISDSEWEIMKVVWLEPGLFAGDVVDRLGDHRQWSPRTVKTLISRLLKKGALRFENEGTRYRYFPAIRKEEAVREESKSFMKRVFDGMTMPMLAHFVKTSDLDSQEIATLKKLLEEKAASGDDT